VQSALIALKARTSCCCCENDKADAGIREGAALSTNQRAVLHQIPFVQKVLNFHQQLYLYKDR
jgi:hypothetical protein